MSVFRPRSLRCVCGAGFTAALARCLDVRRTPRARLDVLAGTLHEVRCPSCGTKASVEDAFLYVDPDRGLAVRVLPSRLRYRHRAESRRLAAGLRQSRGLFGAERDARIAFGLAELREKVLAKEAGLDDRVLEFVKALLLYEHPVLMKRARLRLDLAAIAADRLDFVATYEHHPTVYRVEAPRWLVESMLGRRTELRKLAIGSQPTRGFFADDEQSAWVNVARLTPVNSALERLAEMAERVSRGEDVNLVGDQARKLFRRLPRGNDLPAWAKQALRALETYAKARGIASAQVAIFEVRFGKTLDDEWASNEQPDDIDTLWQLLEDLPDTNVEGNTRLREIRLEDLEVGGIWDAANGRIDISRRGPLEGEEFEDTIRHEVGHATHEMLGELVTAWLESRFGWRMIEPDVAGIDAWVAGMGGWGGMTEAMRVQVRTALLTALGPRNTFDKGPGPQVPEGHPWLRPDCLARFAYANTPAYWWDHTEHFQRSPDQKRAYFLNYWYGTLCAVDVATLEQVRRMPRSYAAMSPAEFFAELYALYFDSDDPTAAELPEDVRDFFRDHVAAGGGEAPGAGLAPSRGTSLAPTSRWRWLTTSPTAAARGARPPSARAPRSKQVAPAPSKRRRGVGKRRRKR